MVEQTQTAAVIGATGSFGGAVTRELVGRGWRVRALVRDPDKARAALAGLPEVELIRGDALVAGDVERAVEGADLLVNSFNVPYPDWDPKVVDSARIVADVAARRGLLVLFPGNVYGLGPDFEAPLAEDAPREAPCRKGVLRNRIEDLFEEASRRGGRFLIVRCGDFFGPDAPAGSSWFHVVTGKVPGGGPIVYPGRPGVPHAWAYLPDVARVAADLVERADELGAFETFHFEGHVVDRDAFVDAVRAAVDDPGRKVKRFPWWAVGLARPFSPFMRELHEMRYLWDEPVRLDGSRLRATLPEVPHTPLREAVRRTLEAM
ncbi:MAG: NAD(P)H-binding protein [Myxococcota bacterium]